MCHMTLSFVSYTTSSSLHCLVPVQHNSRHKSHGGVIFGGLLDWKRGWNSPTLRLVSGELKRKHLRKSNSSTRSTSKHSVVQPCLTAGPYFSVKGSMATMKTAAKMTPLWKSTEDPTFRHYGRTAYYPRPASRNASLLRYWGIQALYQTTSTTFAHLFSTQVWTPGRLRPCSRWIYVLRGIYQSSWSSPGRQELLGVGRCWAWHCS